MLDARPETRQLLACLGRQVVVGHLSQAGVPLWGFLQTATTKRSMVAPTSGELILRVIELGVADPRTTSSVQLQQPGVGKGATDRGGPHKPHSARQAAPRRAARHAS